MNAFDLGRFLDAQANLYPQVCAELSTGRKRTHWMWFIFPQIAGLGSSATARTYAIKGLDEARAYLAEPVLGLRLRECTALTLAGGGRDATAIFGFPDDLKLHSSMTLFAVASGRSAPFVDALGHFFEGRDDLGTLERLGLEHGA